VSVYATVASKSYRVRVELSNGTSQVVVYDLYLQHPVGAGPGADVVEIDGVDRGGKPASVVVPVKVLLHFIASVWNGEVPEDFARELLGERGVELLKEAIRERRL